MGYYTYHTIEVEGEQPEEHLLEDNFQRITGYSYATVLQDSCKWYDCDQNMLELSKLYPSTIFHIWGDGEESDDNWHAVYCNGSYEKVQAELVYPDIDVKSIGGIGKRHPEYFI